MLPGHKMLLRYKTLDKCFRSSKKWTLEMLVEDCSKVLGEKISKRSIQSDIQFLRDNNAPISVCKKKYYEYTDKSYSILKAEIPEKLEEQFIECIDFVKEISDFPKYKRYKDSLHTITPRKDKIKAIDYVKLCEQQLVQSGFFVNHTFFSPSEIRKITNLVRSHKIQSSRSIADDKNLLSIILTKRLRNLVKKINSRAFLVEAVFNTSQEPTDYQQLLNLPMRQRKIPQNLTLWGYPAEEKHEKPDRKELYKYTFAIQIFLKDVTVNTGALQVVPGSHQRELSPLEIGLITNNTYPSICEVEKGSLVGYNPMLIQRIAPSESPKNKQSITLWFSSYHLPVHYLWNNEINL